MKIDEILREDEQLDEVVGGLVSIANWFGKKYHDVLKTGSIKVGQGEVQRFTNKHMRTFMQMMGRYQQNWDTVTMRTVYQYMRLVMKLSESEIVTVVNGLMVDPTVRGKKLSLIQIQDAKSGLVVGDLSAKATTPVGAQVVVEKLIAAAAMKALENHWEQQAGVKPETRRNTTTRPKQSQTAPATSTTQSTSTKYVPNTASLTNVKINSISDAIKQMETLL